MPTIESRRLIVAGVLAMLAGAGPAAAAGDVVLFEGRVPDAAELGRLLWPEPAPPVRRTRSWSSRDNLDLAPTAVAARASDEAPRGFAFVIRFKFDSAEILPESRPYLDRVGQLLSSEQAHDRGIDIVGHADASGPEAYNQKLSEARAAAVRAYLMAWYGIPGERLPVSGRGEQEPRAGTDPYDPTNRRVEFLAIR
jgi:outer membrane protein OmpA-like peptidoglycan-associated protein